MKLLRTSDLSIGYDGNSIISDINLEVLKGQVVCLLGPNGSGKTTFLRTLCGLLAPVTGVTYLNDINIKTYTKSDLAKHLAVVLTEHTAPEFLKVSDLVGAARYPHTGLMGSLTEKDRLAVAKALDLVSAGYLADRFFLELSDGEQQKVLLARALAQETEVIVLDEPTSFLDLKNRIELIAILTRLSKEQGLTVVLSLHELDLAAKCCDIAILIKNGKILCWGPPETTVTDENVQHLYELNNVSFNILTGSSELINKLPPRVLVVAGGGTGIPVYRGLTRAGWGFMTGILQSNDLDFYVSQSMGVTVICSAPFEAIDEKTYGKALEMLDEVNVVIDTGFMNGTMNQKNIELIKAALRLGKHIITLRKNCYETYTNDGSSKIAAVSGVPDLLSRLQLVR